MSDREACERSPARLKVAKQALSLSAARTGAAWAEVLEQATEPSFPSELTPAEIIRGKLASSLALAEIASPCSLESRQATPPKPSLPLAVLAIGASSMLALLVLLAALDIATGKGGTSSDLDGSR